MKSKGILVSLTIAVLSFSAFASIQVSANIRSYHNHSTRDLKGVPASTLFSYPNPISYRPYSRLTFVYSDPASYLDEYAFLASIPANVFRDEDENFYVAPIIYGETAAGNYLLEDWKAYCDEWGGVNYVDFVGQYGSNYISNMKNYLGTDKYTCIVADDPYEYAAEIALRDWTSSSAAVIAPATTYFTAPEALYGEFHGEFFNVTEEYYVSYPFGPIPPPGERFDIEPPVESPHPYLNDMYQEYTVEHLGATYVSIHFLKIDVETHFDYLYIYDRDWNLVTTYTGYYEDVWTPPVPGDLVRIVLSTDFSITYWGFIADAYVCSATPLPSEFVIHRGEWLNYTVPANITGAMVTNVQLSNWTSAVGETWLTCFLIDPEGNIVDYDFTPATGDYTWIMWDINERPRTTLENYTIAIYCLGYENATMDCGLVVGGEIYGFSGEPPSPEPPGNLDIHAITVPQNAKELDAWLSSNSTGQQASNLCMWLIDPEGNVFFPNYFEFTDTEYPPAPIYTSNIGRMNAPYPTPGNWTLIVEAIPSRWTPLNMTTEYTVQYTIQLYDQERDDYIEAAANSAVIASLKNVPLLYTANNFLPEETAETLQTLNVEEVIFVDTAGIISETVKTEVGEMGITVIEDLANLEEIISYIRGLSGETDLILTVPTESFFAPAALAGAFHGAPVLTFKGETKEIPTLADSTWASQYYHEFYGWGLEWLLKAPPIHWMHKLSEIWSAWIGRLGADADGMESVLTVAPLVDVKPVFERAIAGIAKAGRIPGENAEEDVAFVNRAMLYPVIIYANLGYNVAMPTCVTYDYGLPDIPSDGWNTTLYPSFMNRTNLMVNQTYVSPVNGWENTTEAMRNRNFTVEAHIGKYEVFDKLNSGVAFWYHSNHGGLGFVWDYLPFGQGVVGLWYEDPPDPQPKRGYEYNLTTFAENASVPDQYNLYGYPYPDGAVFQTRGEPSSLAFGGEFDRWLGNIHSVHVVFMDCYVGGSMLPLTMMRHGAASAIGDMRTGLLIDTDWFCVKYTQEVMAGKTLGEAFVTAVTKTSYVYPNNYFQMTLFSPVWVYNYTIEPDREEPWIAYPYIEDCSNAYVLYGDPEMIMVNATAPMPEASNPNEISVMGHDPDHVTRAISINITAPTSGTFVRGVATISWTINLQDTVLESCLLYIDGIPHDVAHQTSYSWNTTETLNGNCTITLVATDLIDNVNSTAIWVIIDNPTVTLHVSIESPSDCANIGGETIVSIDAFGFPTIQRVEFYIDNNLLYNATSPPYEWTWNTTQYDDGPHVVMVEAYDPYGKMGVDQVTVKVDNTPPAISVQNPENEATVRGETLTVTVNAFDEVSNVALVEFYVDGQLVYTDTEALYSWAWNTTQYTEKTYIVKAVAYDAVGNNNVDQVTVTVDKTVPSVNITSPKAEAQLSGTVLIEFEASDPNLELTQLLIDNSVFTVTGTTLYEWDTSKVGDGSHTIKLVVYDKAGNSATTEITVTTINVRSEIEATRNLYLSIGIPLGLVVGAVIAYAINRRRPRARS